MSSVNVEHEVFVKHGKANGTLYWDIANFSQLCPETATEFSFTRSSTFSFGQRNGKNLKWRSGVSGAHGDISCVLILATDKETGNVVADDKPKFVSCSSKIGFGNENNPFVVSHFEMHHFNMMEKYSVMGVHSFISISDLYGRREELLEEDTLRITIQMEIHPDHTSPDPPLFDVDYLFTGKFSDVQIYCEDFSFPCHKLILSVRSSVFNRMFESGHEEVVSDQVHIEDMEPIAVETLLKFIYTSQVNLPENCSWTDLLYGAEKYDLKELKNFCFKKMLEDITMDNFGTLYVAAQKYNATVGVRVIVTEYYKKYVKELMGNPNFRNVLFKNPRLFYRDYQD